MMMNFYNRNLAAKKRTPFCSPPWQGGLGGQTRRHVRRTNWHHSSISRIGRLPQWRVDSETPLPPCQGGENSGLDQPGTLAIVRALVAGGEHAMRWTRFALLEWDGSPGVGQVARAPIHASRRRLCGKNISCRRKTIPGSVIRPSIPKKPLDAGNLKKRQQRQREVWGQGLNPSIGKGQPLQVADSDCRLFRSWRFSEALHQRFKASGTWQIGAPVRPFAARLRTQTLPGQQHSPIRMPGTLLNCSRKRCPQTTPNRSRKLISSVELSRGLELCQTAKHQIAPGAAARHIVPTRPVRNNPPRLPS